MKKSTYVSRFLDLTKRKNGGFTLIEILVVIGIIALLATIVIVAITPARQFAQARNTQRTSHVNSILNAIGQRYADNKGLFHAASDTICTIDIPSVSSTSAQVISSTDLDLRPCLVPTYISELPVDPAVGVSWNGTTYNTAYKVYKDLNTGRVTVFATTSESTLGNVEISVTR